MPRLHPKKYLINIILFLSALFFILYINHSPSSPNNPTFSWTHIRYRPNTKTSFLGSPCPALAASKPALVVSHVHSDGDTGWLRELQRKYTVCIYDHDRFPGQGRLGTPGDKGHEAMAYLTFVIDNYDLMPAAGAVFVHGARWAWHNDFKGTYDNWPLLTALNVTAALEGDGYHNLKCDWAASTCGVKVAQGSLETAMNALLEPWNIRTVSDAALPKAMEVLFGSEPIGRTHTIRSQCCAQFVVSQERIWQHTRDEYIALRQWLLDGTAPSDDRISGRILSYLWHVLFLPNDGKGVSLRKLNEMACPTAKDCYCRLYGICNVSCRTSASCEGQYAVLPNYKLPADWTNAHDSQDLKR